MTVVSLSSDWINRRIRRHFEVVSEMVVDVKFGDSFSVFANWDKCRLL